MGQHILIFFIFLHFNLFFSDAAHSSDEINLRNELSQEISLQKHFLEKVVLVGKDRPAEVIYGNDVYGYFRAINFLWSDEKISTEFFPPGRNYPLKFFVKNENGTCFESVFRLNKNRIIENIYRNINVKAQGQLLSYPFLVLVNTSLIEGVSLHIIVNRIGEVVMALPYRSGVLKQLPNGWALLRKKKLDFLNYSGTVRKTLKLVDSIDNDILWYSHDFLLNSSGEITTIANKKKRMLLPPLDILRKVSNEEHIKNLLISFLTESYYVRANEIHRFDKYGRIVRVWHSDWVWSPLLKPSPSLVENLWTHIMGQSEEESGLDTLEHLHLNSLSTDSMGKLLISLRDQNEVVLLSEDWNKVEKRISLLYTKDGVYKFHRQHDAQFMRDETKVMLFNNNSGIGKPSEIVIFKIHTGELVLRKNLGHSTFRHGSVFETDQKTIIYSAPEDNTGYEHIGEVSFSGDLLGELTLKGTNNVVPSYRVLPVKTFSRDSFLGFETPVLCKNE